jgi:hemerythrin superfamily protein
MDAIALLEAQHRDVEDLFAEIEESQDAEDKQALLEELVDLIAIHAAIEERHLYPRLSAFARDRALASVAEHQAVKAGLADMLDVAPDDDAFIPLLAVLKERTLAHVSEEERIVFPLVESHLDSDAREALGRELEATADALEDSDELRAELRRLAAGGTPAALD